MGIFSLEWFKSWKEKDKPKVVKENVTETSSVKPYKSAKMVNNVITVILPNGELLCKTSATPEDFEKVVTATSLGQILKAISSFENLRDREKVEEDIIKTKLRAQGADLLKDVPDFEVGKGTVSLIGTNRTLPPILVNEFLEVVGQYDSESSVSLVDYLANHPKYQALKNFFLWACLNPRAEVADQLYSFLMKNSFRITKQGFFAALRNVVTVNVEPGERELVDFVTNSYNKIKAVWKKKPSEFSVYSSNDFDGYKFIKNTSIPSGEFQSRNHVVVGNLEDLYKNKLVDMPGNRFTDHYTHTFDIRVGKVVNMPPEQCNWSTADCAHAGLHFTADQIHYVGCGDTSVLILINPMKVVGIGTHKGRCYEYLPIMTVPRDEATELLHDLDFDTLELDEEYAIHELNQLEEQVKKGFAAEVSKYNFNLPALSTKELTSIVRSLSKMRATISKRVSTIQ